MVETIKIWFIDYIVVPLLGLIIILFIGGYLAWECLRNLFYEIKNKVQNKMKKMKDAVLNTAKQLLVPHNTVTTLELKLQLRKDYPLFYWNQVTVSQHMDEFAKKGVFTYADNGTYRVYSDPTLVIVKVNKRKTKVAVPVAKTTPIVKTTKTKLPSITRNKALNLMQNNKGHFFTALFVKKDGTDRKINCQYQSVTAAGYIQVTDMALRKKDPNNCIRNINLKTLKEIKIAGTFYKVK